MLVPFPGEELFERTIPVMAITGVVYKPNQPFGMVAKGCSALQNEEDSSLEETGH